VRRGGVGVLLLGCILAAGFPGASAAEEREPAWLQAESEHFIFIFEPRDRDAAEELLTVCEPVYRQVCGFFDSWPKKVPCVIRGRVDQANGMTTSFPSKIELYLTAPTDHFLGARTESWLKALLAHELTHYVQETADRGLFHRLSVVFGSEVATLGLAFLPGWMIEGPAVFNETRFTEGGRGRNPLFEMYPRALVEQGKLFTLPQAGYLSPFPPPGRIYVAGDLLLEHICSAYGEEAFRRILDAYLAFPFFGPWDAIRRVTGRSAEEIFEDLREDLQRRYRQASPVQGGQTVSPPRIGDWTHPQPTRDGLFAYRRSPYEPPAIVRLDTASGTEQVIAAGSLTDFFSFSATADGKALCFSSRTVDSRDPTAPVVTADLFLVERQSGTRRQLTRGAHLWHPALSADGSRIIAVQGAGPYTRLVSVDRVTGVLRVLYSRAGGNVYTPAFSPDGSRVAFTFNLRGFQDVYVAETAALDAGSLPLADARSPVADVNAAAARPVLGPDAFGEYFPAFADDRAILFSSDRGGSLAVYRADLQAGTCVRVQEDPVAAIAGAVDGDSLLYASYDANGWCIKRTPLGELAAVPIDPAPEASPYPPPIPVTAAGTPARPYADWPIPLAWVPNVMVSQNGPGTLDLSVGVGALAIAGSLLGRSTASVDAAWSTAASQPLAGASISAMAGNAVLTASGRIDYAWVGYYRQTLQGDLGVTFPLVAESTLGQAHSLSLNAGAGWLSELDSLAPFTLADALNAPAAARRERIYVGAGISAGWMLRGGEIDFNAPLAIEASLQNATPLPLLDVRTPESDFALFAAVTVPSLVPHQAVKLGVKATAVLGGPFSSYGEEYAVPRGFPEVSVRTAPGGVLLALDYLVPVALLDQPLPFGFALTGVALAVHGEALGQWGSSAARLSPSLFAGGDLTLRLAYGIYSFPLGIGCAARIDTRSPSAFDAGRDLRFYLFLGFDSFAAASALHHAAAACYTAADAR
jgi:hypothetical protein